MTRLPLVSAAILASLLAAATASAATPPPHVAVTKQTRAARGGSIYVAPKVEGNTHTAEQPTGPLVLRPDGKATSFRQLPDDKTAFDFRPQTLNGRTVYTWWEGASINGPGHGQGTDVIADRHLRVIARVKAGNGIDADQHEFRLIPGGHALITSYVVTDRDLTAVGGPKDGKVFDGVAQEVDVHSGRVLWAWHSLDHVPLADSYQPLPPDAAKTPWDYFHINAVNPDGNGGRLISARHTWTVYDVSAAKSGTVRWRLGGKHSDFTLAPDARFSWQHNPLPDGKDTIRIFDNHASTDQNATRPSRVIDLHLDPKKHAARLVRSYKQPQGLTAESQGNAQRLPNGHLFVGWGSLGRFSEFSSGGRLLYDAHLPKGEDTYRAYRSG